MRIEGTWRASSIGPQEEENRDLTALAGRWSTEIPVFVLNPATYSVGPILQHLTCCEGAPPQQP